MRSPLTGARLHREGDLLLAPGEAWPVVDGIAFLRADRAALAREAAAAVRAGDAMAARVMLLADQDGWARSAPPDAAARREVAHNAARLTFREAMDLLALGPVAAYFAHRWSDPTFLSGLALAEAYWTAPARVLELACGAGHFLREFSRACPDVIGADLVFAKLWLARTYVAPEATLLCFDAAAPWPLADASADTVFCHDALYFFERKPHVANEMRRVAGGGAVLVGHAHNAAVDNFSAGAPLRAGEYAALFGEATLFDDRELTQALVEARAPRPADAAALETAPAIALAAGAAAHAAPRALTGGLAVPPPGAALRRNPLYAADGDRARIAWPSARYRDEYAALATYPEETDAPESVAAGGADAALARRRVLLDLPARW